MIVFIPNQSHPAIKYINVKGGGGHLSSSFLVSGDYLDAFYFVRMSFLPVCMCTCVSHIHEVQKRIPENGFIDGCEPSNLGLSQQQQALLTAEPSVQCVRWFNHTDL